MRNAATMAMAMCGPSLVASQYSVVKTYNATNIFDEFYFRSAEYYEGITDPPIRDPTHGAVAYLDKADALRTGLASTPNGKVKLSVDSTNKVDPVLGRPAVRLESKETFDTGLLVADIEHMPGNSCGTWPAMWTYNMAESDNIPVGEIDFLEGTIDIGQSADSISLHTGGQCMFPNLPNNNGDDRPDCDLTGPDATGIGCGIESKPGTYGDSFNAGGGGVYAVLVNAEGITIWMFPRDQIPADLKSGKTADPSKWAAKFQLVKFKDGSNCNTRKYFKNQTIIINTTFCGDNVWNWAIQSQGQCGATSEDEEKGKELCAQYVVDHPADFADAYWLINSVKLYQM